MPIPDYGAAPLAKTFVLVRGLSIICMIAIVGMTSNFVAQIVSQNVSPPSEIVGTLTITCLATFYTLLSLPFFFSPSSANLTLLIMTGTDLALLLAFLIISIVLGKPLSFLNCLDVNSSTAAADAQSSAAFAQAIASVTSVAGARLSLGNLAASTRTMCYETKAVWGLCISLAILFCCSGVILPTLWFKARRVGGGGGKSAA